MVSDVAVAPRPTASVRPTDAVTVRDLTGGAGAGLRGWALLAGLLAAAAEICLPFVIGAAVGRVQGGGAIAPAVLPIAAVLAVTSVLAGVRTWVLDALNAREMAGVRRGVLTHVSRLGAPDLERAGQGEVLGRFQADVDAVVHLLTRARLQLLVSTLTVLLALAVMVVVNVWLLGTVVACLAVSAVLLAVTLRPVRALAGQGVEASAHLVTELTELLRYPRTIKVYGLEGRYVARFVAQVAVLRRVERRLGGLQGVVDSIVKIAVQGSLFVVIGVGAWMIATGATTWAELSAFVVAFAVLAAPLGHLAQLLQNRQKALASVGRLHDLLDLPPEPAPVTGPDRPTVPAPASRVEFDGVGVRFDGRWILRDVTFTATVGRVLCLSGASGAGKSTLLSLVPRLLEPTEGRVLVDGVPVGTWPLDDLRRRICIVEQDTPFLGRTVRESLATGDARPCDDELRDVLDRLGLAHLVTRADGLDTVLNRHGTSISGGERQRLAVARAMLSDRPICLLDEPTAHLHAANEERLLDTLASLAVGRIVIVASHSERLARAADEVVELPT